MHIWLLFWSIYRYWFIIIGYYYICLFSLFNKYFETAKAVWTLVILPRRRHILNWIEMDMCIANGVEWKRSWIHRNALLFQILYANKRGNWLKNEWTDSRNKIVKKVNISNVIPMQFSLFCFDSFFFTSCAIAMWYNDFKCCTRSTMLLALFCFAILATGCCFFTTVRK